MTRRARVPDRVFFAETYGMTRDEANRVWCKRTYWRRRTAGKCVRCGNGSQGKCYCDKCALAKSQRQLRPRKRDFMPIPYRLTGLAREYLAQRDPKLFRKWEGQ